LLGTYNVKSYLLRSHEIRVSPYNQLINLSIGRKENLTKISAKKKITLMFKNYSGIKQKISSTIPVCTLSISCFGCNSNMSHMAYAGQSLGNGMKEKHCHLVKGKGYPNWLFQSILIHGNNEHFDDVKKKDIKLNL
jgi:hypothetical protein